MTNLFQFYQIRFGLSADYIIFQRTCKPTIPMLTKCINYLSLIKKGLNGYLRKIVLIQYDKNMLVGEGSVPVLRY